MRFKVIYPSADHAALRPIAQRLRHGQAQGRVVLDLQHELLGLVRAWPPETSLCLAGSGLTGGSEYAASPLSGRVSSRKNDPGE